MCMPPQSSWTMWSVDGLSGSRNGFRRGRPASCSAGPRPSSPASPLPNTRTARTSVAAWLMVGRGAGLVALARWRLPSGVARFSRWARGRPWCRLRFSLLQDTCQCMVVILSLFALCRSRRGRRSWALAIDNMVARSRSRGIYK